MKIETKFDIGQSVFIIRQYKKRLPLFLEKIYYVINEEIVYDINVKIDQFGYQTIEYTTERNGLYLDQPETSLFATKEEAEQILKELEGR